MAYRSTILTMGVVVAALVTVVPLAQLSEKSPATFTIAIALDGDCQPRNLVRDTLETAPQGGAPEQGIVKANGPAGAILCNAYTSGKKSFQDRSVASEIS